MINQQKIIDNIKKKLLIKETTLDFRDICLGIYSAINIGLKKSLKTHISLVLGAEIIF